MNLKLAKYAFILGFFLVLVFGVWMAFQYHSNVVVENGRLQAEAAEKDIALRVSLASSEAKDQALFEWKQSAKKLEETLESYRKVAEKSKREVRILNERVSRTRLEALSRGDSFDAERHVNEHTLYLQCKSTEVVGVHIC